jgi:uncharacterized membrane protein YphA (DoxX/SURF4 family)
VNAEVRAWIGTLLRLGLAGVLGFAGAVKLTEPQGAREAVLAYRVFPVSWASFLGWTLPGLEIVLAILLLLGLFTRWTASITALLMMTFIVLISSVWIRGYSIDCGCFGGGGDTSAAGKTWRYASELLRDFLFTGMAVWLVAWPRTKFSLDGPGRANYTDTLDTASDDNDDIADSEVGAEGTTTR